MMIDGYTTDLINRQEAIKSLGDKPLAWTAGDYELGLQNQWQTDVDALKELPPAQPERKWIPCSNPPKHHKDVIVRGIESIGNVTAHKVMQWDIDTWRPMDFAPSVIWKEWSEI